MANTVNLDIVACRLRELRKKSNKSQQAMADYLNISRPAYTCYESGKRLPMSENLFALADLYNVSVDYLLGRTDDPRLHIQEVETDRGVAELHVSKPLTPEEIEKFREIIETLGK